MYINQQDQLPIREILKYRETDGFFCDGDFNVWHKGRCLGNIWNQHEWAKEDLDLFNEG